MRGRPKNSDTPPAAHPRRLAPPALLTWQSHASRARAGGWARVSGGCATSGAPTILRQTPRRSLLLTVVLTLALCATASAQAPPAELWDSGAAVGGATGEDGRSVLLFALALVAFAGAG